MKTLGKTIPGLNPRAKSTDLPLHVKSAVPLRLIRDLFVAALEMSGDKKHVRSLTQARFQREIDWSQFVNGTTV